MAVRMTSPTARPIPRSLAPVLAELELAAPDLVDRPMVSEILARLAGAPAPEDLSHRVDTVIDALRRSGWLLPLSTRGVWEFAPAARSGAYRSGDPFLPLRAHLHRHPDERIAVAIESAAFLNGLAEHSPALEVIAVPDIGRGDGIYSRFRTVHLDLGRRAIRPVLGTPVHTVEALLVSMAAKPTGYRDWPNVATWLPEAIAQVLARETSVADGSPASGLAGCLELMNGRSAAVWARFAYLFVHVGDEETAGQVLAAGPERPPGPVYLGPRDRKRRHYDRQTRVVDAVLSAP